MGCASCLVRHPSFLDSQALDTKSGVRFVLTELSFRDPDVGLFGSNARRHYPARFVSGNRRIGSIAVDATKSPTTRFHKNKVHRIPAFGAGRRRGVFWHGMLTLIGREYYRTLSHR